MEEAEKMKYKFLVVTLISLFATIAVHAADKPNIIYILADDLGYGDLGCYGSKLNSTPNIDRMALNGIRFTDFQAASWCAPSRSALMTGCHPNRPGLLGGRAPKFAERATLADMLKDSGYATALIGKWHLGMGKGAHPMDQGFDYWYGTRGSNDWDGPGVNYSHFKNAPEGAWKTPYYVNRKKMGIIPQSQTIQRYTKETIRLIQENKDRPFFIYLAHNMPHVPIFASDTFKGKSKNGVYGDVLMELDWSFGEIIKAVKAAAIDKKTIVVFTSDNGPWTMFKEFAGVAKPLRGEKSTTWEGGGRVPAIFYWPDTIKSAVRSDFIVSTDVYATLAGLTGSTIGQGQAIDSHDFSGVLRSKGKSRRTRHIYYHHQAMAYRNGDYKIHFFTRNRTRNPDTGRGERARSHKPPVLFDVTKDIQESRDIAADHPDIVKRMTEEFNRAKDAIRKWKPYLSVKR